MKQIINEQELIGKTIKKIFDDGERSTYILFTDDTFCMYSDERYSDDWTPPEIDSDIISLVPDSWNRNVDILIKLGAYTEEEKQAEIQKIKAERDELERVEKIKRDAENAKKELATYKRLKAKYEK